MAAKLPEMRMKRNGHRMRLTESPVSSAPVRSAITSLTVGRSVNVKIVASRADQNRIKRNASHGTPGRKYWCVAQSSRASGRVKTNLTKRRTSDPASFTRPQIHPSSRTPKRSSPAQ